jgi:hypothetical protein
VVLPNGLVAFLTSRGSKIILRAVAPTGQWAWEQELLGWSLGRPLVQADHVIAADGATLRAGQVIGGPLGRGDLVVAPGWPARNTFSQFYPTVVVVDVATGERLIERVVPWAADSMAAGSTGVAVAGSLSAAHWSPQHRPGYELTHTCYVLFLDETRALGEWKPERPITGPSPSAPPATCSSRSPTNCQHRMNPEHITRAQLIRPSTTS